MAANPPPFDTLPPPGVSDRQLLWAIFRQLGGANGSAPPSGGQSVRVINGASFDIPAFDSQEFTYVNGGAADDDDIATQVFKNGGTTVATLTYTYFGSTNNIQTIVQS